jgi:hypothetical protein
VFYQSVVGGEWFIKRRAADGTSAATPVTRGPSVTPTSWSSDGKTLALTMIGGVRPAVSQGDLFTWRAGGTPQPLIHTSADEDHLEFSPSSPHYAYVSDESGQSEVYVAATGRPDTRIRVSTNGGDVPAWTKMGRELVYVAPGSSADTRRVMAVDVTTPNLRVGRPYVLFESAEGGDFVSAHPGRNYDVSPSGERFMTSRFEPPPPDRPARYIEVVLNWFDELRSSSPRR